MNKITVSVLVLGAFALGLSLQPSRSDAQNTPPKCADLHAPLYGVGTGWICVRGYILGQR